MDSIETQKSETVNEIEQEVMKVEAPLGTIEQISKAPEQDLKVSKHNYADKQFWNERFLEEKANDWYISWELLRPYLEQLGIPPDAAILNVGSGNSAVPFDMCKAGLTNVTSIDISDEAIRIMKAKSEQEGLTCKWIEADATNLSGFMDSSYDVVIDKGTLDALVCDDDDLIPTKLIQEMFRVTKISGNLFIISHSAPSQRESLMRKCFYGIPCQILYCKQSLDKSVNMVNAIRCFSGGLSLGQLIKDPVKFVECLKKWKAEDAADQPVGLGWKTYNPDAQGQELINQTEDGPVLHQGIPRQSYCFVIKITKLPPA
jgi:EEF1A lysine methyltransferase 4